MINKQHLTRYMILLLCCSLGLHVLYMYHAHLLVEEAYYWNYAQHLDWSYLDHPPMVACLIKLVTLLFGTHELAVRTASLFCWGISARYSYKLSELIYPHSGRYSLILLATLPFFFFQSIIITPDAPLIAAWSACLYFLYRALVLQQKQAWYWAGLCLGLGMLSKYTIVLLPCAAFCFSIVHSRTTLKQKEPYLAVLISVLIFTPVIYWNAQHEWVSLIFQSTRRFNDTSKITIHHVILVALLYVTPLGFSALWGLLHPKSHQNNPELTRMATRFLRYATFIPFAFFLVHSVNHQVNFNWTGPLFLALIPWIAANMAQYPRKKTLWNSTAACLLILYASILLWVNYNSNERIQKTVFLKIIDWNTLVKRMNHIAQTNEKRYQRPIVFAPLDNYPINSELAFYQKRLLAKGEITKQYPSTGAHLFQRESLMYRYWSSKDDLKNNPLLILLAKEAWRFDDPNVTQQVIPKSKPHIIWSHGQGQHVTNIPYMYQVVELKTIK